MFKMTTAIVEMENPRQGIISSVEFGDNLIERFIKFIGVAEKSRETYIKALKQMFQYFAANEINAPTREDILNWVESLKKATPKKSPSTIQLYLTSCKIFFRCLAQEGIFANITDHIKAGVKVNHNHKRDELSLEQCRELVDSVKGNSLKARRDKAILTLMTTAGLRTIEVVRANVGDIRFERGKTFLYVTGKGHFEADEKVLLSKQAYKVIRDYLQMRGTVQSSEPLFTSTSNRNKNSRLDTQTIRKMVKYYLRNIGLDSPRLSAHSLRHAVASGLISAGVELPKVQIVMRHKSLATTMIYQHAWERHNIDSEQILSDKIFGTFKD